MNQQKTGEFLKALRKEKGMTQEKTAEIFNVSSRTVSRWENGVNMPDLSMLAEIADYYDVDIREIIDGERKSENNMDKEIKETVLKAAEYTDNEKTELLKKIRYESVSGTIALVVYLLLRLIGTEQNFFLETLESAALVIVALTPIMITLYTSGLLNRIKGPKVKNRSLAMLLVILMSVIIAAVISGIAYLVMR